MRTILKALLAATLFTGCYADDNVQYGGGAAVAVQTDSPDLVEVSPGVQVIADYDEPIFFTDGLYWRNYGGYWYSSSYWGGGWGRAAYTPVGFGRIGDYRSYSHYRPAGWHPRAYVRAGNRGYRGGEGRRGEVRHESHESHSRPSVTTHVHHH